MLNQNEKVERFAEEINKTALNQCKKIERQTAKFSNNELKKLEEETRAQLESRLQYEEETIKTKLNREISAVASASKSDIINRRNEIMAEVFSKAQAKLVEFTKTDRYKVLLEKSIYSLTQAIDKNVVIYVRRSDFEIAQAICSSNPKVSAVKVSDAIKIGLAFACDEDETVFANDTLENRLEQQKEQFMADSGLTIL